MSLTITVHPYYQHISQAFSLGEIKYYIYNIKKKIILGYVKEERSILLIKAEYYGPLKQTLRLLIKAEYSGPYV